MRPASEIEYFPNVHDAIEWMKTRIPDLWKHELDIIASSKGWWIKVLTCRSP